MKAAVFQGPNDTCVIQIPDPILSEKGIIMRVCACGICGSDIHFYRLGNIG